jgi:hypothetical protein
MRVLLLTPIDKLDKDAIDSAFCRAIWVKKSKKVMECRAKNYPIRRFTNLPNSPIKFDPDKVAEFFNKDVAKKDKLREGSLTYVICEAYTKGKSFKEIEASQGVHRQQVKQEIQKGLKWFLEHHELDGETKEGKKR